MATFKYSAVLICVLCLSAAVMAQLSQIQKINPVPGSLTATNLGFEVVLSGDIMVVGEPQTSVAAGLMRVFKKESPDNWQQVGDVIAPPWGAPGLDAFGSTFGLDGDRLITGAYGADIGFSGKVAIWTIDAALNTVTLDTVLSAPEEDAWIFAFYGIDVALSGDVAVVGARNTGATGGSAFIYERDPQQNTWAYKQKIFAEDAGGGELFGHSVAIDGDWIIIGAPDDTSDGQPQAGSVYLFHKEDTLWTKVNRLTAGIPATDGKFGWTVDIDGDYAVVGSLNAGDAEVDIYHFDGSSWMDDRSLSGFEIATDEEGFIFSGGLSLNLSGTSLAIGASAADSTGACYIYTRSGDQWLESSNFTAEDIQTGDGFGFSVALSADIVAVGAPYQDSDSTATGAVYLFDNTVTSLNAAAGQVLPGSFTLQQNYPNPFNPVTNIPFTLNKKANVRLIIYDINGREVAALNKGNLAAGSHTYIFDAADLPSGVYFYKLQVADQAQSRKLILVK